MKKTIIISASFVLISTGARSQTSGGSDFNTMTPKSKSESNSKNSSDDDEEKAYKEGAINITVGYGFPNMYKSIYKALFTNNSTVSNSDYTYEVKGIGPAFLKIEYGLSKLIGLGAVIGYSDVSVIETNTYDSYNYTTSTYNTYHDKFIYKYTSLSIGARLNFHFATGKKLDPYAGIGAGYSRKEHKFSFSTDNPNQLTPTPVTFNAYFPVYFGITAGLRYYFTPNIGLYGEVGFDKWSVIQGGLAVKF